MTPTPDGGPAYPAKRTEQIDCVADGVKTWGEVIYPGMSLRDWFAGQAIGWIVTGERAYNQAQNLAAHAYGIADAMLQERSK